MLPPDPGVWPLRSSNVLWRIPITIISSSSTVSGANLCTAASAARMSTAYYRQGSQTTGHASLLTPKAPFDLWGRSLYSRGKLHPLRGPENH